MMCCSPSGYIILSLRKSKFYKGRGPRAGYEGPITQRPRNNMLTIRKNPYSKLPMGCVFIDFSKSFDTILQAKLLQKLNSYRIRNVEFEWFSDYLFNCKQKAKLTPCPNLAYWIVEFHKGPYNFPERCSECSKKFTHH